MRTPLVAVGDVLVVTHALEGWQKRVRLAGSDMGSGLGGGGNTLHVEIEVWVFKMTSRMWLMVKGVAK